MEMGSHCPACGEKFDRVEMVDEAGMVIGEGKAA
jgi:uncharacterized protein (UPF0212 family)